MELVNLLFTNMFTIISALLMIIGGASILAKFTPTPKDDTILATLKGYLEKLALNPIVPKDGSST